MKSLCIALIACLVLASCAVACPLGECYAQPVLAAPPVLAVPSYGAPAVAVQPYAAPAIRVQAFSAGYGYGGVQAFSAGYAAPLAVRQGVFVRSGFRAGFSNFGRSRVVIRQNFAGPSVRATIRIRR